MQKLPQDELRQVMRLSKADSGMDNQTAIRLKKKLAEEFRDQLMVGAPTNEDEVGLDTLYMQSYICFSGLIRSIQPQDILGAAI
jgi:hypothetical protein